jgi:hypothetical protein
VSSGRSRHVHQRRSTDRIARRVDRCALLRLGQSEGDRVEGHGRTIRLVSDIRSAVASVQPMRFLQASFNQSCSRGSHIADMTLREETAEDQLDLGSLVRVMFQLGMVEQGVQDTEVGMPELAQSDKS